MYQYGVVALSLARLHACRLIALPSGYHLATVDAVRELLSAQAQTVETLMRPAQYGASWLACCSSNCRLWGRACDGLRLVSPG